MSELRWVLKEGDLKGDHDYIIGPPFEDGVEVMPVSEHEELHATAQEVVDAAAAFPRLDRYAGLAGSLDALRAVLAAGQKERGSDV